jgi:hypothetical protein
MSLPKVNIDLSTGNLGLAGTNADGVAALILIAATSGLNNINTPTLLTKAADAATVFAIDPTANAFLNTQIKEFYAEAGDGSPLWTIIVPDTNTMAGALDPTDGGGAARMLLDAAGGSIRLLGIAKLPPDGYDQTGFDLDPDVYEAVTAMQALYNSYFDGSTRFVPFRGLVEGRGYFNLAGVRDITTMGCAPVGVVLGGSIRSMPMASVGLVLGRAARIPVHHNLGRVKDGKLNVPNLYWNGQTFGQIQSIIGHLHDFGYITFRIFDGRDGFFITDDNTATAATDDLSSFARGRVIDKAVRTTYATYVTEISEHYDVDDSGRIATPVIKYLENEIVQAIKDAEGDSLSAAGNAVQAFIDPGQNVLSTNKVSVKVRLIPKFYNKEIDVDLGFTNPQLNTN